MTKTKVTKQTLFMSVVALLLCFTMLMGATFAWFTDTEQNTGNRIQAGNLDVDLIMDKGDGNGYVSIAEGTGDIFNEAAGENGFNWEPGKTQIVYLGVRNNGSLALKYNILLDIVDGNPGLIGSLEYAIIDGAESSETYTSWDAVKAAANGQVADVTAGLHVAAENGTLDEIVNQADPSNVADADREVDYFAFAVHMKEEAGNEYQNGSITIDVVLNATQKDAEFDSFGNDYDKDAEIEYREVSGIATFKAAIANKEENIVLASDIELPEGYEIDYDLTINGGGNEIRRADDYEGALFTVKSGNTINLEDVVVDGGAVWASRSANPTTGANAGATATDALIVAEANSHIVLEEGTVLQNNDGAVAVNLGTRIGATLTINGAEIINNRSNCGAIWGGGNITINSGKISYNSSTGLAGAIRMVSNCNLTMNGGEISHNSAVSNGGAIYGYGASKYNFNGGEISYNTAALGGAIYTGDSSVINMSGDFEMHHNTADDAGAIRFTNYTSFNMTGGKFYGNISTNSPTWNGFYGFNVAPNITGGEISDDFTVQGGYTPTLGGNGITGVVHFGLATNHNTVNLAADFGTIKFTVAEGNNFASFNFKPTADYTYAEGDEAKLVCLNEGYSTYWDAEKGVFKIKANA